MPSALILCGSLHRGGVTDEMCSAAAETLRNMGYETRVFVPEGTVSHCTGCGKCENGPCVIRDGMDELYDLFSKADLLVLATPIHFSGPSSVMKTMIDRFQPYWFDRGLPHPSMAMGLMCGGSERPEFENTAKIFRAFSAMTGMKWLGHTGFPDTDRNLGEGAGEAVSDFIREKIVGAAERSSSRSPRHAPERTG